MQTLFTKRKKKNSQRKKWAPDKKNKRNSNLEVVQHRVELLMRLPVQTLARQKRQFVGVLARGGNAHRPRPIVIHVRQLVSQALQMIGRQRARV